MRYLRSLVGKPVIRSGGKIGRVLRAAVSADMRRMTGIWVDEGLRGTRFIPAEEISVLGEATVHVDAGGRHRKYRQDRPLRVVSTAGARLGAVSDAVVDETTFAVAAIEVTLGVWEDLTRGRLRAATFAIDPASHRVIVDENEMIRQKERV